MKSKNKEIKKKQTNNKRINKKKILIILLGIIIGILITLVSIYFIMGYNFQYKTNITIEAGSKVPLINDYLYKDTNEDTKIEWIDMKEDSGFVYKAGIYNGKFKYKNKDILVRLTVKDTTGPLIKGVKEIESLAYEEKKDIMEGIEATDNSKESIKVEAKGNIDYETPGVYKIYYIARDSSGNETIKESSYTILENKDVSVSKSSKDFKIVNYHGITYVDDTIIVNKSYGLPSTFAPLNLVKVNSYIEVVDFVLDSFNRLKNDAKNAGLNIYASSGYRSYSNQEYIYNYYIRIDGKEKADTYSARKGHSEHQTGLSIDVNTVDYSFEGTKESNWLKDNCYKYGFIIRFPKEKEEITGYMYEPWHIRYVGNSLAETLYNNGDWLTLEEYYGLDSKYKD